MRRLWPLALAGLLGLLLAGCLGHRPMFILRHFAPHSIRPFELPCCFDGAVIAADETESVKQLLRSAGKGVVAYFGVHSVQPEAIRGEWRTPWFSFLADTVMAEWGAYLVPTEKDTALYAYYGGNRYLINWAVIDSVRAERFARAQLRCAGPQAAAFWDVFFPTLSPWMFNAARGARLEDVPVETRTAYRDNMLRALRIARRVFRKNNQRVPWGVIVNGDWNAPPPVYLEGIEQTPLGSFSDAMVRWQSHQWNVASVRSHHTAWVDSLLLRWADYGGIVAFTHTEGDPALLEDAYRLADGLRQ